MTAPYNLRQNDGSVKTGLNYLAFMHPRDGRLAFLAHKSQFDQNPLQDYHLMKAHEMTIFKGMVEPLDKPIGIQIFALMSLNVFVVFNPFLAIPAGEEAPFFVSLAVSSDSASELLLSCSSSSHFILTVRTSLRVGEWDSIVGVHSHLS